METNNTEVVLRKELKYIVGEELSTKFESYPVSPFAELPDSYEIQKPQNIFLIQRFKLDLLT